MAYSDIFYDKHEAIATITINRPRVMNACTIRTYGEIAEALQDAERDDAIRAVVLTGAGRGFCAGDDVREIFLNPEFQQHEPSRRAQVEEWRRHDPVALDFLIGLLVLPRLVGLARAYELILSGDIIEAAEAERIGMVNKVVPHEELAEATAAFAAKLTAQAPLAQRLAKEALRVGLNLNLPYFFDYQRHGQHLMLTSKDHLEGARSFLEKRPASFKGE